MVRTPGPCGQTIQSRKHQAVNAAEGHSIRRFAPQHVELVSKNQNFCLKPYSRPEQPGQRACQKSEKIDHRERTSPDSRLLASRLRFPVGTGRGKGSKTRLKGRRAGRSLEGGEKQGYLHGTLVQLLILTGQRRGEIANLRRQWINPKAKTISLPDWVTKNSVEHTFPYGRLVPDVLDPASQQHGSLVPIPCIGRTADIRMEQVPQRA